MYNGRLRDLHLNKITFDLDYVEKDDFVASCIMYTESIVAANSSEPVHYQCDSRDIWSSPDIGLADVLSGHEPGEICHDSESIGLHGLRMDDLHRTSGVG
ncbi:hypothetical protein V6N13_091432 [Hibiscus sabdariffa]